MTVNIAIDFDGVIHRYSKGWSDGSIYDVPNEGCAEVMRVLRESGHRLIIFTTRASSRVINGKLQESQLPELKEYLAKHQIPYDEISTDHKPLAHVYLDDRGLRFVSWQQALMDLVALQHDTQELIKKA